MMFYYIPNYFFSLYIGLWRWYFNPFLKCHFVLDFSITKGKGHISTPRKGTTGEYGHYDDFRFPHEINARVTGAMAAVRTYIVDEFVNNNTPKKDIDINRIIRQALDDENLVDIFKTKGESEKFPFYYKNFRQIYKRVLKYAQDLIK